MLAGLLLFSAGTRADVLDDILKRGTLNVGVSLFTPWTQKDGTGQLSGFEIDVANRLAEDMGVKVEYKVYAWEDIIPAVMNGEIDVIAGGMAITPKRALKINFSQPYSDSGLTLAANTELTSHIKQFRELNDKNITIAVIANTASHEAAQRLFDESIIKVFDTAQQAEQAVLNGKVHAWLASSPQPRFLVLQHPGKVDMPLPRPLLTYKAGFGIKKGEQEWLNFLNAWVTARQGDQWLSARHKYWFKSLKWRKGSAK